MRACVAGRSRQRVRVKLNRVPIYTGQANKYNDSATVETHIHPHKCRHAQSYLACCTGGFSQLNDPVYEGARLWVFPLVEGTANVPESR
jgi:hypothetical protein